MGLIPCLHDEANIQSNEPSELSQWLCHDDNTINIGIGINIIIMKQTYSTRSAHVF